MKTKKYATYDEYKTNKLMRDAMILNGCEFVYGKSMIKIVIGGALITLGAITIPFPTGSIPMIILGLSLLANGGIDILKFRSTLYWHFKTKRKIRNNDKI